ncbi:oligosaccharide flippase family protein [Desulfoluna spongiiphila]|nr:oligosaccharide flippase family protein [Desulfoluna spongiiphila]
MPPISLIKRNIIANFAGSIWMALMSLVFIPLYIHFTGIEAYGLVGFYATLQGVFALLDMGLSSTLNREMAGLSAEVGREQEMRNMVRTLEFIYWGVAVAIVVVIVLLSGYISQHWVTAEHLSPETVREAVILMGIATGLQWPVSFYSGGLMGLQGQVLLNVVNIIMATLRGVGAVLILWLVSPTIGAFFSWQIVVSGTTTLLLAGALWYSMPKSRGKACFQASVLRRIWRFAVGMFGISLLATLLTQMDKIILSRMLPLEMFGYYTLSGVVALSLFRLIGPIFNGVYPRLTQLVTLNDQFAIKELYHRSCQVMSLMILPAAFVLAFFSRELLLLWTQNVVTAERAYLLVSLLVTGTALNGLMNIPYALQLAHGWTKLAFYVNLVSVIILFPLIFFMTKHYGAVGGASVWVILNSGYVLITIQLMHRRLLPDEKMYWYGRDVGLPLLCAVVTAGCGRILMPDSLSQLGVVFYIAVVSLLTFGFAAWVTPETRRWIVQRLSYRTVKCV